MTNGQVFGNGCRTRHSVHRDLEGQYVVGPGRQTEHTVEAFILRGHPGSDNNSVFDSKLLT